ncbi:hypothetical protein ACFWC5_41585 [Streptomyces sp. NPDC060085]|uniref:hypothetical protein n=1 Tax=Streptomyces sp. NPDC060085 TaxID=3347054 RepID=UPI003655FE76
MHHSLTCDQISKLLEERGIFWREPEVDDSLEAKGFSGGFPYEYLIHLRRAFALSSAGMAVTPATATSKEQYTQDLQVVRGQTSILYSHLLLHGGVDGYYIPVPLPEPAIRAGHSVGSSQRLIAELTSFASAIDISLDEEGNLTEEAAAKLDLISSSSPYAPERFAWYQLYQACAASIADGHAIVLH